MSHKIRRFPSKSGGDTFYSYSQGTRIFYKEMHDAFRKEDLELINIDEHEFFMNMLYQAEINFPRARKLDRSFKGDTQLLNRIIRNGGIFEYMEKLEHQITA